MPEHARATRMAVVAGIDALRRDHGPLFVVVGVFDGLHLGHAYLLDHLVEEARRRSSRPAVITFDHHPDEVLTGAAPPLLCDPDERLARLEEAGVRVTVVQHFDQQLRATAFDTFIRRIAAGTALAGFLMTPDSAFGYQRGGTADTVASLGRSMGFDVAVVPNLEISGQPVRSTDIRGAIAQGDLGLACRLLGRPYSVTGRAVGADGAGMGAGVPLEFPMPVALPPAGRYAVEIAAPVAAGPSTRTGGAAEVAGHLMVGPDSRVTVTDTTAAVGAAVRLVFDCS